MNFTAGSFALVQEITGFSLNKDADGGFSHSPRSQQITIVNEQELRDIKHVVDSQLRGLKGTIP